MKLYGLAALVVVAGGALALKSTGNADTQQAQSQQVIVYKSPT